LSLVTRHSSLPLGEIRAGTLQVTLAQSEADLRAAQELRYRVFVREKGAGASPEMHAMGRDADRFDAFCDHLLVLEHASGAPQVVGTYRLLRREAMKKAGGFYSADEFDLSAINAWPGEVLELGRSCVDENYRSRAVMQLLWRGIGAYVGKYNIEIMFGCASLHGTDPKEYAKELSYLHHYHTAPPELRLKALPARYVDMNMLPKGALDAKRAFAALPALVKGYLRLGGYASDGAVVDYDYNTVDVGILVKTDLVTEKYVQRYGQKEG
jgi:putative hemolysin